MGELVERRWAVISEHGCEASGLGYAEAAELVRRLAAEKIHGLCVVTDEAARHLPQASSAEPAPKRPTPARG